MNELWTTHKGPNYYNFSSRSQNSKLFSSFVGLSRVRRLMWIFRLTTLCREQHETSGTNKFRLFLHNILVGTKSFFCKWHAASSSPFHFAIPSSTAHRFCRCPKVRGRCKSVFPVATAWDPETDCLYSFLDRAKSEDVAKPTEVHIAHINRSHNFYYLREKFDKHITSSLFLHCLEKNTTPRWVPSIIKCRPHKMILRRMRAIQSLIPPWVPRDT